MKLVDGRYVDEAEPVTGAPPDVMMQGPEPRPMQLNRVLVAGLVVVALVASCLAALLYLEHRQPADERAVTEVVTANLAAWNAGDTTEVLRQMAPGGVAQEVLGLGGEILSGGSELDLAAWVQRQHSVGFEVTATGPVVVTGSGTWWQAAVPIRSTSRWIGVEGEAQTRVSEGMSLFALAKVDGEMRILDQMFWYEVTRWGESEPVGHG